MTRRKRMTEICIGIDFCRSKHIYNRSYIANFRLSTHSTILSFIHLYIYLSNIHPPVPPVPASVPPFVPLSGPPSSPPSLCWSLRPSIRPSIRPSVNASIHLQATTTKRRCWPRRWPCPSESVTKRRKILSQLPPEAPMLPPHQQAPSETPLVREREKENERERE